MLEGYLKVVRKFLPSPFTIALVLSIITFLVVLLYTHFHRETDNLSIILDWWKIGLFDGSMLVFAMQMMLMLVLGHILALSSAFSKLIQRITIHCTSTSRAAFIVASCTLIVGLFNWGLGLIFGALLARKVGEFSKLNKIEINYPLIAASGYAALMIWHGGFSGSALIKAAEDGHLAALVPEMKDILPNKISLSNTVFSRLNLFTTGAILLMLPTALYFVGRHTKSEIPEIIDLKSTDLIHKKDNLGGAEFIDRSSWFPKIIGFSICIYSILECLSLNSKLDFFIPNNINLLLFGAALSAHKSINSFLAALDEAISGTSGILIQFPLYFGIMGLMRESGLITDISHWIVSISDKNSFPLLTYISAGLINIVIPSGGGQWAIQGPIIVKSSLQLGIPLERSILAFAYGDQITNMLQPFWALPLLGITKLAAKDILPFSLIMFVVGFLIYGIGLALV